MAITETGLPISIDDLLSHRRIESDRIEFKEGWNPDSIYRSICAFANDYENIGGGYILIGVAEKDGIAVRPVKGLSLSEIATIQKEMIGFNNLIRPSYAPRLSLETVDGNTVLALWIPGGSERPYEVPESIKARDKVFKYYIRRYASSIEAKGRDREELIGLASKQPFDDRANREALITDVNLGYVQEFLRVSGSKLFDQLGTLSPQELLNRLHLLSGPAERQYVKNVALMLFNETPERFFPYSYIDIVHFKGGPADRSFTEKRCTGPMQIQIRQALDYLQSVVLVEKVTKVPGQAEAQRAWNYPYDALEELVVNAVYHRNYEEGEPITIRIEKSRIMIYNCGGPDRSINLKDLQEGTAVSGRYRNRRLGDFLKEMDLTEGRSTGLSLIHRELERNGSPPPIIETDDDRTFFRVILALHPAFDADEIERTAPPIPESLILARLRSVLTGGDQAGNQADDQADDLADDLADNLGEMVEILKLCAVSPRKQNDLFKALNKKPHTDTRNRYLDPLEKAGLIEKTIPDKPTSPKQQYRLTDKGRKMLTIDSKPEGAN